MVRDENSHNTRSLGKLFYSTASFTSSIQPTSAVDPLFTAFYTLELDFSAINCSTATCFIEPVYTSVSGVSMIFNNSEVQIIPVATTEQSRLHQQEQRLL